MCVEIERARLERRQSWHPAISSAELDLLAVALADRRLSLTIREHRPLWYDFCPPVPYPAGIWQTPYYLAGQAAKHTLGTFQAAFDVPNAAMPTDVDTAIAWLRECIAWDAGSSRAEAIQPAQRRRRSR